MTKEEFERYPFLCRKVKQLSAPVTDTVKASSADFPFGEHTISVRGTPTDRQEQLEKYQQQKMEIERFIISQPEDKRDLLWAVALNGPRWNVVRRAIDSWKSPDAVRKEYERLFKA